MANWWSAFGPSTVPATPPQQGGAPSANWWEDMLQQFSGSPQTVTIPTIQPVQPPQPQAPPKAPVAPSSALAGAGLGGQTIAPYGLATMADAMAEWRESLAQQGALSREQMALQKAIAEMELAYKYKLMETQDQQAAKSFALQVGQLELQRQLSTGWVQKRPITASNMPSLSTQAQASTPGGQFNPAGNWGQMMGQYAKPGWWQGGARGPQ